MLRPPKKQTVSVRTVDYLSSIAIAALLTLAIAVISGAVDLVLRLVLDGGIHR